MTAINDIQIGQPQHKLAIDVRLRKASLADAQSIAQLGAHTFSASYGHSLPREELQTYLDESYSLDAISQQISDPSKDMIVATTRSPDPNSEDVITGFALLTRGTTELCLSHLPAPTTIQLHRMYIQPDYQGHGIAKLLASQLEDIARIQGYTYMWLGVWVENTKAQRIYERMGYEKVGARDFVLGKVVQTGWVLVKKL